MFGLQEPQTYEYTNRSKCFDVQGIDDKAEFQDTLNAMNIIGLSQGEQDNIFRMLAAILWLGNVTFREDDSGNATIADQSVVDFVAYLLQVQSPHVNKALTIRIVETARGGRRGSVYEVPLNPAQATAVRDALAKAIYFNLFDWIVDRVNASLKARGSIANSVGILDIYGFEIFEKNSFALTTSTRSYSRSLSSSPSRQSKRSTREKRYSGRLSTILITRSCASLLRRNGHPVSLQR